MTKYFNYTFKWYGQDVTISEKVTDRAEERNNWKPVMAAEWMTQWVREHGMGNTCVHARNLVEVSKKEMVSKEETAQQMETARNNWLASNVKA